MPLKSEKKYLRLGDSLFLAKKDSYAWKDFKRANSYSAEYRTFIDNYITAGCDRYVLPHHCVIKENSDSTRLIVVYDTSCKSSTGVSLNDRHYAKVFLSATRFLRYIVPLPVSEVRAEH